MFAAISHDSDYREDPGRVDVTNWEHGTAPRFPGGDNGDMDTTQDTGMTLEEEADAALAALEEADPAAAPEIAEAVAESLTTALNDGERSEDADGGDGRGRARLTLRRLDRELVRRKLAPSRSAAREAIDAGLVEVGGVPAAKPATLVDDQASVRLRRPVRRFVGRGGLKLEEALNVFSIDVATRRALDVGASTGGFTDCLLQRGARSVVALDVGYGQLDWGLRNDERVDVIERTNFRHVDPASIGAPFDVVVADLSFISLRTVAPQLAAVGGERADYALLVKTAVRGWQARCRSWRHRHGTDAARSSDQRRRCRARRRRRGPPQCGTVARDWSEGKQGIPGLGPPWHENT